jgi:hypothetical protein
MHVSHAAALWLLALIPLPLLLTRRRTPVARFEVSNVFLWRAAARRVSGSLAPRRVRRSWLVATQMACIAAIVVALSGPVVTVQGGLTAVVFDVSASMGAREDGATRFEVARARARSIIKTLPPASQVRLILAAASPRDSGTWNAADPRLASAINALTPTAGRADTTAAVDAAARRGDVDKIIVFSDTTRAASGTNRAESPSVQWVHVGRGAENSAVARVVATPTRLGEHGGEVVVVLKHYGRRPREADVEIAVDGRAAHRTHVRLDPGGTRTLKVALSDLGRIVTARLVEEDALPLDNVRSVRVPSVDRTRVALFGLRGSFLEHALAVNPSVTLRTYGNGAGAPDMASALSRDGVDVVVCDDCMSRLPPLIPALVVADGHGQRIRGLLTSASVTHPLMASLEPGPQRATVWTSATANAGADVLLRVGGVPAVTAAETDGRRSVDVQLDLAQPDFALTPAFPILIANVLAWLTAPGELADEATAGEPLTFSTPLGIQASVRVVGPDGRPRDVQRVGQQCIVADTDAAGAYRVDVNGSERSVIVNPSVDGESDLFASEAASFDRYETTPRVSVNEPVAAGRWMMLAALALLGLEWRLRMAGSS